MPKKPPQQWIVVRNWQKFQHYHDRAPIWIKCYTDLLHDDDWLELNWFQRGILLTIWLEYGSSDGILTLRQLRATREERIPTATLDVLAKMGWIALELERPPRLSAGREAFADNGRPPAPAKTPKRYNRGDTPETIAERFDVDD